MAVNTLPLPPKVHSSPLPCPSDTYSLEDFTHVLL
jgi:hypothetical protein